MDNTIAPPAAAAEPTIEQQVALAVNEGWRVESLTTTQAVLVKGKRCNHLLHFFVTLFTLGLWIPVWIILAIVMGEKRKVVTVSTSA